MWIQNLSCTSAARHHKISNNACLFWSRTWWSTVFVSHLLWISGGRFGVVVKVVLVIRSGVSMSRAAGRLQRLWKTQVSRYRWASSITGGVEIVRMSGDTVAEGAVTAVVGGIATVTATYEGQSAQLSVSVRVAAQEPGTVRVLYARAVGPRVPLRLQRGHWARHAGGPVVVSPSAQRFDLLAVRRSSTGVP